MGALKWNYYSMSGWSLPHRRRQRQGLHSWNPQSQFLPGWCLLWLDRVFVPSIHTPYWHWLWLWLWNPNPGPGFALLNSYSCCHYLHGSWWKNMWERKKTKSVNSCKDTLSHFQHSTYFEWIYILFSKVKWTELMSCTSHSINSKSEKERHVKLLTFEKHLKSCTVL